MHAINPWVIFICPLLSCYTWCVCRIIAFTLTTMVNLSRHSNAYVVASTALTWSVQLVSIFHQFSDTSCLFVLLFGNIYLLTVVFFFLMISHTCSSFSSLLVILRYFVCFCNVIICNVAFYFSLSVC